MLNHHQMKVILVPIFGMFVLFLLGSFAKNPPESFFVKVEVENLWNDIGNVQFALYNKDGSIPDEHYKKHFKIGTAEILNGKSSYTFMNLPEGTYAVNILHDEDKNGKIDKGFILPKEGIGFSNYSSIGLSNRPNFSKASFVVTSDRKIKVKVIYMGGFKL